MGKQLKVLSKDRLVHEVIQKFDERSAEGYRKYGKTLAEDKDTLYRWVNDVQEELMDAILYLQKVKHTTRELVEEMYIEDKFEPVKGNQYEYDGECDGTLGNHPLCCTDYCPCKEKEIEGSIAADLAAIKREEEGWPPKTISAYPGYTGTITRASGDITITYDKTK